MGLASLTGPASGSPNIGEHALQQREIAYARAHLGGAALASLAKGGDPDGGSERAIVGASRGDGGGLLGAAEELAARKAFPAQQIDAAQTFGAQQAFNTIKIRGNRGSRKGASSGTPWGRPRRSSRRARLHRTRSGDRRPDDRPPGRPHAATRAGAASGSAPPAAACGGPNTVCTPTIPAGSSRLPGSARTRLARSCRTRPTRGETRSTPGTGEPNASGDSEAGLGVYKSTDGGDTWS